MYDWLKRGGQARRLAGLAGAIVLAAGACESMPSVGIPLACSVTAYIAAKSCGPQMILRGRILSPWQHHRAAMIIATLALAAAAVGSTTVYALDLAAGLEAGLENRLELANHAGRAKVGQVFVECRVLACARARIVQAPGRNRLGVAALSGFTLHSEEVYGWSGPVGRPPAAVATTPE